ncbi:MAG: FHA domain-containing protein [Pirellulaceae bacterium]
MARWGGGPKIPLDHLPAMIGRHPDCDVQLPDPTVSRLHCEISQVNGHLAVLDFESKCGTSVNGRRVLFAHLVPGDTLRLGRTLLVVEDGGRTLRIMLSRDQRRQA